MDTLIAEGRVRPISLRALHFLITAGGSAVIAQLALARHFDPADPLAPEQVDAHARCGKPRTGSTSRKARSYGRTTPERFQWLCAGRWEWWPVSRRGTGANVLGWNAIIFPIAAGNSVVVKPSEQAPISAGLVMAEIAEAAGFPPGAINVVTHAPGAAGPIADVLFDRPEVRCINFIGSARTARVLAERAGRALKRSVMELGGYNPIVVLADADLDYAVRVVTFSAFFHQGQVCMCAARCSSNNPSTRSL